MESLKQLPAMHQTAVEIHRLAAELRRANHSFTDKDIPEVMQVLEETAQLQQTLLGELVQGAAQLPAADIAAAITRDLRPLLQSVGTACGFLPELDEFAARPPLMEKLQQIQRRYDRLEVWAETVRQEARTMQ